MSKISIEGKIVAITHNTRCEDTVKALQGEKQTTPEFTHMFDFADCSDEQILTWACENRLIAWRSKHKPVNMNEADVRELPTLINCSTDFIRERKSKKEDPALALLRSIAAEKGVSMEELLGQLKK